MTKKYNVAVVGATGMVGETIIDILESRKFPINKLFLLASERSAGKAIQFCNSSHVVKPLETFDFSQVDFALFSAGTEVSATYAPLASEKGCIVIDNSSCFRYDDDIPLIVPEVNGELLTSEPLKKGIIANPNCSTIQMLVAIKPIHDVAGVTRINVATYQAVSGSGRKATEELAGQTAKLLNGQPPEAVVYPEQIAFNVLPHIDDFQENGYTKEEMKMIWETQKIMGDANIQVNPTAVRVPVFYGHSEAIHLETASKISVEQVRTILQKAPGIRVIDERGAKGYPTPIKDASGKDEVFIGRIREDLSHPNGINLWVVSDNVRKGAALNAVQIAELLVD